MAVLGNNTSTSTFTDSNGTDVISTVFATAGATGLLGPGWVWFDSLSGTGTRSQNMRLGVWASQGILGPGSLLGVTNEVIITQATPTGWVQFPYWTSFGAPPSVVSGVGYWLGPWWGTVANAANVFVRGQFVGTHDAFFNAAETYSSTGNPPAIPSTDDTGGGNKTFSWYFDIIGAGQTPSALVPIGRRFF